MKVEFKGVNLSWGAAEIFKDLSWLMGDEPMQIIHGAMGTGKSSFLGLILGLHTPDSGEVLMDGEDLAAMSFEEIMPFRRRIGFGFDLGGLLNNRSLRENISLPMEYHALGDFEERKRRTTDLIERFDLGSSQHLRPAMVSGGQRKATCIARAFALSPEMVILDEPTVGLSSANVDALLTLMRERIGEGSLRSVVATTNDIRFDEEIASRHWIIQGGQLGDLGLGEAAA